MTRSFRDRYDNFQISNPETGVYYFANVIHLSVAFLLVYTAFSGIQNLSTSVLDGLLGHVSPALLYIVFTLACLVGPSFVNFFGVKRALLAGFTGVVIFGLAYFVALQYSYLTDLKWILVLFSAAMVGFLASPIWTAQGAYMTANAKELSKRWADNYDPRSGDIPLMGFANGVFWLCFQLTQVSGNVIPSIMLHAGASTSAVFLVYMAVAIVGVTLTLFLRPLEVEKTVTDVRKDVSNMVGLWSDYKLLLMIPIIMYNGLEQGWIWGDFTAQFAKVSLGLDNVGYIMAIFGVCDAIFSYGFGFISDKTGRLPIIYIGCIAQLVVSGLVIALPDLKEGGDNWGLLVAMAALWALGDASLNTQLNSMISESFGDNAEAGFANFKLWQSLMVCIAFVFPELFKYRARSGILAGFCAIGLICVTILRSRTKSNKSALPVLSNLDEPLIPDKPE